MRGHRRANEVEGLNVKANKSEEIRQYLKKHPDASNAEVVKYLVGCKILVTETLVAAVKRKYLAANGELMDLSKLKSVREFAESVGGLDNLIKMAHAIKELSE